MKSLYPISGTFIDEITYDIPSSNWNETQWKKEFDYMKESGIDTVILIRGCFNKKSIYPSKIFIDYTPTNGDFLKLVMEETEKRNMNVFVGMFITDIDWQGGDYKTEIEQNKLFVDEVLERYNNFKSFKGWYIPHEVGNDVFNITKIFKGLGQICKEKSPDKKILISPFFLSHIMVKDGYLSPKEIFLEWDKIFEESGQYIDYCAFQDGSSPIEMMEDYYINAKKACDKHNIEMWANIEGMGRDIPGVFMPIDFDVLKKKIEIVKPYVKKLITFEFSHFLSPQSIYLDARELNKNYIEYYDKINKNK